jgi:hypothetical protein
LEWTRRVLISRSEKKALFTLSRRILIIEHN